MAAGPVVEVMVSDKVVGGRRHRKNTERVLLSPTVRCAFSTRLGKVLERRARMQSMLVNSEDAQHTMLISARNGGILVRYASLEREIRKEKKNLRTT